MSQPVVDAPVGAPDESAVASEGDERREGEPAARAGRDLVLRWAMVAVLAPLAVSAVMSVVAVGGDYVPVGDLAMTEMHVRDIGHHPVLVGLHSRPWWNHPGPLQFYVVAPFYWLTGGSSIGLILGALAVNGASVAGVLLIARRRGGTPLVLCSAIACLVLMRSTGPEALGDAWNLEMTLLPFLLMTYLTWSMLSGEWWALPVGTAVASFLVQTHIGFAATAAPLLALGAATLVARAVLDRRRGDSEDRAAGELRRQAGAVALAGAIAAVAWLPPLVDIAVHAPDNRDHILDYFTDPPEPGRSLDDAWRVTAGQFGLHPEWLTGKRPFHIFTGQSLYLTESVVPVGLVLVAAAALALWRRGRDPRGLVVTLGAATVLVLVSILRTIGNLADYRLRYTWVPPALAAVAVLWAGWLVLVGRRPGTGRVVQRVAAGVVGVLALAVAVSAARAGVPHEDDGDAVATLAAPVVAMFDGEDGAVVVDEVHAVNGYSRGLLLQLERNGIDARVTEDHEIFFSRERVHDGGPVAGYLMMASDGDIPALLDDPGLQLVARWSAMDPDEVIRLQRERDELHAAWQAGELDDAAYSTRLAALMELEGGGLDVKSADVAVFLDERPPPLRGTPGIP